MIKNMGKTDKTVRLIAAIVIAVMLLTGILHGAWGWILGIVAVIFAATSAISFCPLYKLIGISTLPRKEEKEETKKEEKGKK